MLKSSELLKKKICVTVFLDELFEELDEEAHETPTQENKEVKSVVKIAEEPPPEQVNMFICENGTNECGDNKVDVTKTRPRKTRQQSKFGKSNNNLGRELNCCGKTRIKEGETPKCEPKPKLSRQIPPDKPSTPKLSTYVNNVVNPSQKMSTTVNSVVNQNPKMATTVSHVVNQSQKISTAVNHVVKKNQKISTTVGHAVKESQKMATTVNKSVMTDEKPAIKSSTTSRKIDQEVDCTSKVLSSTRSTQFDLPDISVKKTEVLLEDKELQTEEKYWPDIQPGSNEPAPKLRDNGGGEVQQQLEPRSVGSCPISHEIENIIKEDSLFVSSSSEQISNVTPEEVIRVWSTCKKVWNESVESDMSEVECITDATKVMAKEYSAALDCSRNSVIELEKTKTYTTQFLPSAGSDTKFLRSCRRTAECKQETKSAIIEMSRTEDTHPLEQTKFRVLMEPTNNQFECRSKNFAEGDIFEELGSNLIFQLGSKDNIVVCDKVLSEDTNEAIMNKAKVQFINSKALETISQHFAEVFMKQENGSLDTESEMIFAESPYDAEEIKTVEGLIPKTQFLKRMNTTIEIFGNPSINDIEDLSNELILICEDINKENIYLDGWRASTKSLSEMKELYLKDSKDSTMYLIEIPFIKSAGKGFRNF